MIKFKTESGSTYQVDTITQRIRRVSNANNIAPTERQTNLWKSYQHLTEIVIGKSAMISWNKDTTPLLDGSPEYATPATITSPVVEVVELELLAVDE